MGTTAELQLSTRESDVLNVLWESSAPLAASEIVKGNPALSINTVQVVLRNLLAKKAIEVADIGYSGTVLCRRYRAVLTAGDLALYRFNQQIKSIKRHIPVPELFSALLKNEEYNEKDIAALEKIIQEKRGLSKKEV